jgi:hypothetical protein
MADSVVVISLWRDDMHRDIKRRVDHLLSKSYPVKRFIWVVGNCQDETEDYLHARAERSGQDVTVVPYDSRYQDDDPDSRLRRLSETFNAGLDHLRPEDDTLLVHESDLISPVNVIERLLAVPGDVRAGWPVLTVPNNGGAVFYDTYAYRKDGQMFINGWPYHPCYRAGQPFEVDSVGSCWLAPALDFRAGIRCDRYAVMDLMRQLKANGRRIVVDPTLMIEQPAGLWTARQHGGG